VAGLPDRGGDRPRAGGDRPRAGGDRPRAGAGGEAARPAGTGVPASRPRRLPVVLVLLGLIAAAFVILYLAAAAAGPTAADAAALRTSIQLRGSAVTAAAVLVTHIGSTVSMTVLALLVGAWSAIRGRWADAVLALGAAAGGLVLFRELKALLDRARPPQFDRLVPVTNQSLPSGHATMSVVVIGSLVALGWAARSAVARAGMVLAATAWVGAVGATRVYLGVHWFTDVLAGWLVGAAWLAVCLTSWSWWTGPTRARPSARDSRRVQ